MEVYESHLGGIYFEDEPLDITDLYCDECGDYDTYLGHADTWEEVVPMLRWGYEEDNELRYDAVYVRDLERYFKWRISL